MKKLNFKELRLYENEFYLAINKPSGISTLEDRNEDTNILSIAREYSTDLKVCHRIDKETTGVLVMAKTDMAYRHLSLQLQRREVSKIYHAVVHNPTSFEETQIDVPLLIPNKGHVKWDTRKGKPSTTILNTLQNFRQYSLVTCRPITGRRHQIRVHLKYSQHPIVADLTYGGTPIYLSQLKRHYNPGKTEEHPIISRTALHAKEFSFTDMDGEKLTIEAPYPKDFRVLLKQLQKYGE